MSTNWDDNDDWLAYEEDYFDMKTKTEKVTKTDGTTAEVVYNGSGDVISEPQPTVALTLDGLQAEAARAFTVMNEPSVENKATSNEFIVTAKDLEARLSDAPIEMPIANGRGGNRKSLFTSDKIRTAEISNVHNLIDKAIKGPALTAQEIEDITNIQHVMDNDPSDIEILDSQDVLFEIQKMQKKRSMATGSKTGGFKTVGGNLKYIPPSFKSKGDEPIPYFQPESQPFADPYGSKKKVEMVKSEEVYLNYNELAADLAEVELVAKHGKYDEIAMVNEWNELFEKYKKIILKHERNEG